MQSLKSTSSSPLIIILPGANPCTFNVISNDSNLFKVNFSSLHMYGFSLLTSSSFSGMNSHSNLIEDIIKSIDNGLLMVNCTYNFCLIFPWKREAFVVILLFDLFKLFEIYSNNSTWFKSVSSKSLYGSPNNLNLYLKYSFQDLSDSKIDSDIFLIL